MNNKNNYEVIFSFDEHNFSKFSESRIKKIMNSHGGKFISESIDYGIKDIIFNINSDIQSLKAIIEPILKEAERSDVRMTVSIEKKVNLILFNLSEVLDKESLLEKLQTKKEEFSLKKVYPSQYIPNDFSIELNTGTDPKQIFPLVKEFLENFKAKNIDIIVDTTESLELDNYKNRKPTSLDYYLNY
jgi:hypothetical protein